MTTTFEGIGTGHDLVAGARPNYPTFFPQKTTTTTPSLPTAKATPPVVRRGRRPKYVAWRVARICRAISLGASVSMSCKCGGIHRSTYYQWIKRTPGELTFPRRLTPELAELRTAAAGKSFAELIDFYEAVGVVRMLTLINEAADTDWRAAKWLVEHTFPDDDGRG